MIHISSLVVDRAGVIRPDLIPLAAFLCAQEYDAVSRGIILDHAAAGAPLADLAAHGILEPIDLAGAEEALGRGGPAPRVEPVEEIPASAPIAGGAPSLADRVAAEADRFRRSGSPLAGFIADQLERVAQLVAFTGAQSPDEYLDREEQEHCDLLAREYDRGFEDGRSRTAGYCPR